LVIDVTPIHNHDGARFEPQLARHPDVTGFSIRDDRERGQIPEARPVLRIFLRD